MGPESVRLDYCRDLESTARLDLGKRHWIVGVLTKGVENHHGCFSTSGLGMIVSSPDTEKGMLIRRYMHEPANVPAGHVYAIQ